MKVSLKGALHNWLNSSARWPNYTFAVNAKISSKKSLFCHYGMYIDLRMVLFVYFSPMGRTLFIGTKYAPNLQYIHHVLVCRNMVYLNPFWASPRPVQIFGTGYCSVAISLLKTKTLECTVAGIYSSAWCTLMIDEETEELCTPIFEIWCHISMIPAWLEHQIGKILTFLVHMYSGLKKNGRKHWNALTY